MDRLVTEVELYLGGHYADWLRGSGRQVPAWGWINQLAHGSEEDIVDLTNPQDPDDPRWDLIADLAEQLLRTSQRVGTPVRTLQLSTVIPLESRLRDLFDSAAPSSRTELAAWIFAALEQGVTRHDT